MLQEDNQLGAQDQALEPGRLQERDNRRPRLQAEPQTSRPACLVTGPAESSEGRAGGGV